MYIVYKDRDGSFALELVKDGVTLTPEEMQEITKIEILFKGLYFNSTDYPAAFDWASEEDSGIVIFSLGLIPDIIAGRDRTAELIIYSPTFTSGKVWSEIDVQVIELFGESPAT